MTPVARQIQKTIQFAAIGCGGALSMLALIVVNVGMTGWVELTIRTALAVLAVVVVVALGLVLRSVHGRLQP